MNANPIISVIVPVYNAEKYLVECIESMQAQTISDVEFVFVDDHSSDSSLSILSAYKKNDSRIKIVEQEHGGPGTARNNGIKCATGTYITFLDSDDIMLPDALEELLCCAETTNSDIVLCSASVFTDKNDRGRSAEECHHRDFLPHKATFNTNEYSKHLFQISSGQPWGKMFRRSLVEKYQITFPALPRAEDFAFVYAAFSVANSISIINKRLIMHRKIDGNASLEDAKDKYPLAQIDGHKILWHSLCSLGKSEQLNQTFVYAVTNSAFYNLQTMKTGEAFEALFNSFRQEVKTYNIAFNDSEWENCFCNKDIYIYLKDIYTAKSFAEYAYKYIKNSFSEQNCSVYTSPEYRIGRIITFIPRKAKKFVFCLRTHGIKYTVKKTLNWFKCKFTPPPMEN